VKTAGLGEVDQQLAKLGDKRGTAVLRSAMRAAVKPIVEQARANASAITKGSGALALSMTAHSFRIDKGNLLLTDSLPGLGRKFVISVGPKRKHAAAIALYNMFYRRKRSGIYHGNFVEFARRSPSGAPVPAHPVLLPALHAKQAEAVAIFASKLQAGIARELRNSAKRK
jgi:hypothetical protein